MRTGCCWPLFLCIAADDIHVFFFIKMNQQQNDTNSPLKIRKYTVESEEACFFHLLTNIYSDNESVRKYYQ